MNISNDELRFKVFSDQKSIVDISNNSWMVDMETEGAFTDNITIEIYIKKNNINYGKVGKLIGTYFKIGKIINKQASLFDVFDSIDQDTYELYEAIIDDDSRINMEICGCAFNVFHIERFYIEECYRNLGLGKKTLDLLDDILNYTLNCEVGSYILQPIPIVKDKKGEYDFVKNEELANELEDRLIKFYEGCRYKRIPDTNFLYLNMD